MNQYQEHTGTCTAFHPKQTHREWFENRLATSFADGIDKGLGVAGRLQDENDRLRGAIERHREVCRMPEARDVYPHDRAVDLDLWSVLDVE